MEQIKHHYKKASIWVMGVKQKCRKIDSQVFDLGRDLPDKPTQEDIELAKMDARTIVRQKMKSIQRAYLILCPAWEGEGGFENIAITQGKRYALEIAER